MASQSFSIKSFLVSLLSTLFFVALVAAKHSSSNSVPAPAPGPDAEETGFSY